MRQNGAAALKRKKCQGGSLIKFKKPLWAKNSKPADEIRENAAARFPETDLKQVLWGTGFGREVRKCLIELVGRTGVEPVAR